MLCVKMYMVRIYGKLVKSMNITGVVTEYNPFHTGHGYHIERTKEITCADGIVCVMSGNFMQRGIPAVIDKWNRTKMALENGVDLIIELPVLYSLSSAEFFSFGAVSLLNSLGIVNNISFGSEAGNVDILMQIAGILSEEPMEYKELLKSYLNESQSFARSRSNALNEYILDNNINNQDISKIVSSSNNILGIEYCKSLLKLNSCIKPYTISRLGADYNSETLNDMFSSATSIRSYLKRQGSIDALENSLPLSVFSRIDELKNENYPFTFEDSMLPFLKYKINSNLNGLDAIPDANEGLHHKIQNSINNAQNYSELVHSIKSKRYAYSRISRILCQYFVGFENYDIAELRKKPCPHGRILGLNETGAKILKQAKQTSCIPLYTKLPKERNEVLKLDIQATKLYSCLNNSISPNADFLNSPVMHKEV